MKVPPWFDWAVEILFGRSDYGHNLLFHWQCVSENLAEWQPERLRAWIGTILEQIACETAPQEYRRG